MVVAGCGIRGVRLGLLRRQNLSRLETDDVVGDTDFWNVPGRWNNAAKAMREEYAW